MADKRNKRYHKNNQPPIEVKGDKEILAKSIDTLSLPDETLLLLKNNKFNTIYDLARKTERDMFRVQTFNKKHLFAVKKAINAVGIDFLPYIPQENKQTDNGEITKSIVSNNLPNDKTLKTDSNKKQHKENLQNDRSQPQKNNQALQNKQNPLQGKPQQKQNKQQNKQPLPRIEKKARVELPLEEWQKVSKNGKWGFSNGISTVIFPRFDEVFCFKEGLACVDVDGKFGYIDSKGNFVIEPKFECAMSFSEGLAVFFEGEKCGYINKEGNVVLSAKYEAATAFENGRAKVKEFGKWQTIDCEGNVVWSK